MDVVKPFISGLVMSRSEGLIPRGDSAALTSVTDPGWNLL
jgi:hypothetical protein